jgi:hypothetical protein
LFHSFEQLVPDWLHLYLRITERFVSCYASMLPSDSERDALVARLRVHGVGDSITFTTKSTQSTSPSYRVSLTGGQCNAVWAAAAALFVAVPVAANVTRRDLLHQQQQHHHQFEVAWRAFDAVRVAMTAPRNLFNSDTAIAAIASLRRAIVGFHSPTMLVSNSTHVLLFHVAP